MTGELSPTASMSSHHPHSAHDYSVFANVNIQAHSSSAPFNSISMAMLSSSFNVSNMSINSMVAGGGGQQYQKMPPPPELPRGVDELLSIYNNQTGSPSHKLPSSNNSIDHELIVLRSPHKTSEFGVPPSPGNAKHHHHAHHHHQDSSSSSSFDFGSIPPISPHVNVPPNAHFNLSHIPPPPLPPRIRRRESAGVEAQHRQAPDAPQLPPRDISPPPLPPRHHHNFLDLGSSPQQQQQQHHLQQQHQHSPGGELLLPNTSTIMMRRNSAALQQASTSNAASPTSVTAPPPPLTPNPLRVRYVYGDCFIFGHLGT